MLLYCVLKARNNDANSTSANSTPMMAREQPIYDSVDAIVEQSSANSHYDIVPGLGSASSNMYDSPEMPLD
jgi:hypothetical protein